MQYITSFFDSRIDVPTAISVGKFDGLHRGHELLLNRIRSKTPELASCLVTFDIPPKNRIDHEEGRSLLTREERKSELMGRKIDYLLECPFTDRFMKLSPEEFIQTLVSNFSMKYMAIGRDFRFGYKGTGDIEALEELSKKYGFTYDVIDKISYKGREISSTYIREDIEKGKVEEAHELLGYPYFIWGEIIHGNHIGTGMGVPTINQLPPREKLLPPKGVYITEVEIDHRVFHGVTDIGVKPTVQTDGRMGVETHILDFKADVYEKEAKVLFLKYLRPEMKFDSLEDLKTQILSDSHAALDYFNKKSGLQAI
jgi:riboflavin kinase/FMN adenylyltransferase